MVKLRESVAIWSLRVFAVLFVGAAAAGVVLHYSPVPYWDLWNGYLPFDRRLGPLDWLAWWGQHNEHRILLSRLLFWIDLNVFGGAMVFLLAAHLALAGALFLCLRAFLREQSAPGTPRRAVEFAGLFILCGLFSWMQQHNLTWAFQSQVFLAQLLPLLAFYLLACAARGGAAAGAAFAGACAAGVLGIATMANGIFALPLMAAYAVITRMGRRRAILLAVLAALALAAYFHGYARPAVSVASHSLDVGAATPLQFALLYLGSPWYHLMQPGVAVMGQDAGQVAGALLVVLAAVRAWQCRNAPAGHVFDWGLLAFLAYAGASAAAAGIGRAAVGLQEATSSRYATPALVAWLALLVLYWPKLQAQLAQWRHRILWPAAGLLGALGAVQAAAFQPPLEQIFHREIGALALELGVQDRQYIQVVHPRMEVAVGIAERAAPLDVSIFDHPMLKDARLRMGQPAGPVPASQCPGAMTDLEDIPDDARYVRVSGRMTLPAGMAGLRNVGFVGPEGRLVGQALGKQLAGGPEFRGYLLREFAETPLLALVGGDYCQLRLAPLPAAPYRWIPSDTAPQAGHAGASSVIRQSGFVKGGDYGRSQIPGLLVLGSYSQSYGDTGEVTLRLRRGDKLLYRTGPEARNQRYRIDDGVRFAGAMRRASRWVAITFDHADLPASFTFTLSDAGTGWGEWSALGLNAAAPEATP